MEATGRGARIGTHATAVRPWVRTEPAPWGTRVILIASRGVRLRARTGAVAVHAARAGVTRHVVSGPTLRPATARTDHTMPRELPGA